MDDVVARDIIAKTDGCQGNEDKVESVKKTPFWLKEVEDDWGKKHNKKKEEDS